MVWPLLNVNPSLPPQARLHSRTKHMRQQGTWLVAGRALDARPASCTSASVGIPDAPSRLIYAYPNLLPVANPTLYPLCAAPLRAAPPRPQGAAGWRPEARGAAPPPCVPEQEYPLCLHARRPCCIFERRNPGECAAWRATRLAWRQLTLALSSVLTKRDQEVWLPTAFLVGGLCVRQQPRVLQVELLCWRGASEVSACQR